MDFAKQKTEGARDTHCDLDSEGALDTNAFCTVFYLHFDHRHSLHWTTRLWSEPHLVHYRVVFVIQKEKPLWPLQSGFNCIAKLLVNFLYMHPLPLASCHETEKMYFSVNAAFLTLIWFICEKITHYIVTDEFLCYNVKNLYSVWLSQRICFNERTTTTWKKQLSHVFC